MNGMNKTNGTKGKKRLRNILKMAAAALFLTGCGDGAGIYDLPENAPELKTAVYVNRKDENDGYASIMYGGREYVCYGTAGEAVNEQEVNACVGYTGGSRSNVVCTLKETNDYIMRTFLRGFTDEPIFSRAADTLGKEIYTPDYIDSLDYELWEDSAAEERSE